MTGLESGCEKNTFLTDKQQEALDCVSCFTVRNKKIDAAAAAECSGQSIGTVRNALLGLEHNGLIENVAEPEKRKNLYSSTYGGIQATTPEINPWACETEESMDPLTALQQQALDCVACLTGQDRLITKNALISCIGSAATSAHVLKTLTAKGLLAKQSGGRHGYEYALSDSGFRHAAGTEPNPDCPSELIEPPPRRPLNEREEKILDCIKCQTAKGMAPDRLRASLCTDISKTAIGNAVRTLVKRGIVKSVAADEKPGMRTEGALKSLRLTDARTSRLRPECSIGDLEADMIFARMSPERQRILGCVACVLSKEADSVVGADVARCTEVSRTAVEQFFAQLGKEGYTRRQDGASAHGMSIAPHVPTDRGRALIDRADLPLECHVDRMRYVDGMHNIERSVIRCTSCIWTQQIAAGEEPRATADMIAKCSGFDRSNIASNILPRLVESGEYAVVETKPRRYIPKAGHTLPLGYNVNCQLDVLGNKTTFLADLPAEYIMRGTEDDSMKRFETYARDLMSGEIAYDPNDEYDPFKDVRRFPLLTAEEESYLGMIIQQNTNQALVEKAKFRFLQANIRLAAWMASERRFESAITSFEDVRQAALLGVSDAINRFNPLLGFKFSTFAYRQMLGRIQHITAESVGIPNYVFADIPSTLYVMYEFTQKQGRPPTPIEIAANTGRSLNQVVKILAGLDHLRSPVSLQQRLSQNADSDTLEIFAGEDDAGIENKQNVDLFRKAIRFLDDTERALLERVVLAGDKVSEFARDNEMEKHVAQKAHGHLMAKIRHPYFGLGMHLESTLLDWHQTARCQTEDKSELVDVKGLALKELKDFCDQCDVQEQCERFAQTTKPRIGVWAGRSARSYRDSDDEE